MNNVSLIGRTTDDIELRTTTNNKSVVNFTLAVPRKFKKDETDFIECEAWGKTAELLSTYIHKGQQVGLFGNLQFVKWEKDGRKYSKLIVSVQDLTFIVNEKKVSHSEPQEKREPTPYDLENNPFYEPDEDFSKLPDTNPFGDSEEGLPF